LPEPLARTAKGLPEPLLPLVLVGTGAKEWDVSPPDVETTPSWELAVPARPYSATSLDATPVMGSVGTLRP
jgi:hypothetical protein